MSDTPTNSNQPSSIPHNHDDLKKTSEYQKLCLEVEKLKYSLEKEKRTDAHERKWWPRFFKFFPSTATFFVVISGMIGTYLSVNKAVQESKHSNDLSVSKELIALAATIDTIPEDVDFDSEIKIQIAAYDIKILPFLIDSYVNQSLTEKENKKKELIKSIKLIQYNKPDNIQNVEAVLNERWLNYITVYKDKAVSKIILNYFDLLKEIVFITREAELKNKFKEDLAEYMANTASRNQLIELIEKK